MSLSRFSKEGVDVEGEEGTIGGGVRGGGKFRGCGGGGFCVVLVDSDFVCWRVFEGVEEGCSRVESVCCESANGERRESAGVEKGLLELGSSNSERVGDGDGLLFIWVKGTVSMLSSWDWRGACVPKPPREEPLDFLPAHKALARRDTSPTNEGLVAELVDDPRAAFLRWRSAISHLLRFCKAV